MDKTSFSTAHLEYLAKDFLDHLGGSVNTSTLSLSKLGAVRLLKIDGISSFWEQHKEKVISLRLFMEDIISGLYEGAIPLVFYIYGKTDEIGIMLGTFAGEAPQAEKNLGTVKASLKSSFQGIELLEKEPEYLNKSIGQFKFSALLTGTPSQKIGTEQIGVEQIERMIRGLYGRNWGYLVIASPAKSDEINGLFNSVLNETRIIINAMVSTGSENPIGSRYKELLQLYLNKVQLAKAQGLWHTAVYLFSEEYDTLNQVKAVAKATLGGRESLPDRIRALDLSKMMESPALVVNTPPESPGQFKYPFSYMNTINSIDLSSFIHLPSQEMPGFRIRPFTRFNVSTRKNDEKAIKIGEVLDQGNEMGISYTIPLHSLTKHGLIVGTTGSGKTNTVFYLLKEAWKHRIPFLVIEPVKTEYRKLLLSDEWKNVLQVFTLGNNNISPFKINPFEIKPGVSVQAHIDLLKSVFNASFFMWGPLPHVLERCIHGIYLDKGWDLALNRNMRGNHKDANPTLTDLFEKIDQVVDNLGYSQESTLELTAALKTRIDSLRIGGKGLMLDTRSSIPTEILLSKPTILELEPIVDDEEKCFMMGLLLAIMYENYISQGLSEKKDLQHITVIEEAHRLLANSAGQNPFVANVKGKAVETFTNILAEIRAYGEGFLIAEQIPTKLAPDIVKNTNLKIMHRVVAEDDRRVMGAAMNIDERETKSIVSLNAGQAAVFSEGDDGAFFVKIPYSKIERKADEPVKDDELVVRAMKDFTKDKKNLAPFDPCLKYCQAICKYKGIGDAISSRYRYHSQVMPLTLSIVAGGVRLDSILLQMLEMGRAEGGSVGDAKGVRICAIIHGSERFLQMMGRLYSLTYEDLEKLKDSFLNFYIDVMEKSMTADARLTSVVLDHAKMESFKNCYRDVNKNRQPTSFCERICHDHLCLFRFALSGALDDSSFHMSFVQTINEGTDDMWDKLGSLCREAVRDLLLPGGDEETIKAIALCLALHKSLSLKEFSRYHVETIMKNLIGLHKEKE